MGRQAAAAVLGGVAPVLATGCGGDDLDPWTGPASVSRRAADTDPPVVRGVASRAMALDATSRVELDVPAAYRVEIEGEVSEGSRTIPFDVGGWVLVTAPYDAAGGSNNDGSAIAGRIDLGGTSGMGGPTVSSEYHADLGGDRF